MDFPFYIAKRYLVSKKKQNIINIISGIAISGIIVGTMALFIILSVFNGFDSIVKSMFSSFDPDLKIMPSEGKKFSNSEIDLSKLQNIEGIAYFAEIFEENAILKYNSRQTIATVKGVPDNYNQITNIDSLLWNGEFILNDNNFEYAVLGYGLAYNLGIGLTFTDPIFINAPKKGVRVSLNPLNALNQDYIFPSGIFTVEEETDSKYIIVPLNYARNLFDSPGDISSIEIKLEPGFHSNDIQKKIQDTLGDQFEVKNKYQQHEMMYKAMNSENIVIIIILSFILLISSFNILGSLSMLIIDKKDDIIILKSMGTQQKQIRRIFLFNGWMISVIGAIIGLALGLIICWLQQKYQLIKMPSAGSFIINAYPVEIHSIDLLISFTIVSTIGFLSSWYPLRFISTKYLNSISKNI